MRHYDKYYQIIVYFQEHQTGSNKTATQRAFHAHFMLRWNDAIPDRKSILLWVKNSNQYNAILT